MALGFGLGDAVKGVTDLISKGIDRAFPDPNEAAKAKALILDAQTESGIRMMTAKLSAIIAEAQSEDPWTSRARPSFLYVVYTYLLAGIPMGLVSAVDPEIAKRIGEGVGVWFAAIPDPMWALFGAGYLGYTGARSYWDKRRSRDARDQANAEALSLLE